MWLLCLEREKTEIKVTHTQVGVSNMYSCSWEKSILAAAKKVREKKVREKKGSYIGLFFPFLFLLSDCFFAWESARSKMKRLAFRSTQSTQVISFVGK